MGIYYRIDCDEAARLNLKGNEKDVYFFIKAFTNAKVGSLVKDQAWIAGQLRLAQRTLRSTLVKLQERGLVEVSASGIIVNGGVLMSYRIIQPTAKSAEGCRQDLPEGTAKSAEGCRQDLPEGTAKSAEGPIYNDINDNETILSSNREVTPQPPKKNLYGVVLEVWCGHYRDHFGTEYVPNWTNVSTDGHTLEVALEKKMAEYGYSHEDEQQVREFLHDMLEAFYSVADKWQKEHWSLHTVATQFNQLYNAAVNNNGNGNKQTIEGTNISAEYIARQCAILAK